MKAVDDVVLVGKSWTGSKITKPMAQDASAAARGGWSQLGGCGSWLEEEGRGMETCQRGEYAV